MRLILSVVALGSLLPTFVSLGSAGSARQLESQGQIVFEGCREPCYANDLYSNRADLYTLDVRTGKKTRLTRTPGAESEPAVSANGVWLAYSRDDKPGAITKRHQLWLSRTDSSRPVQLTPNGAESTSPAWFKNDVVYFTRRQLGCYSIFKVATSGDAPRPVLLPKGDESLFQPSVAADGRVAYGAADCEVRHGCCYLEVVDSRGRKTNDLAELPDNLEAPGRPAWSPNGQMIAFQSGAADGVVWVARRDGSGLRRLSPRALSASNPAWSPDGEWIAFDALPVLGSAPFATDLYVVRVDGSDLRRLTRTRNVSESSPTWTR